MRGNRRSLAEICGAIFRALDTIQDLCPHLVPLPNLDEMSETEVARLMRDVPHENLRQHLSELVDLAHELAVAQPAAHTGRNAIAVNQKSDWSMKAFTVEVGGKATLTCAAQSPDEAVAFSNGQFIRSELSYIADLDGCPLWDGAAEITVRPATHSEQRVCEICISDAVRCEVYDNPEDAIGSNCFSFLVPYRD